MAAPVFSDVTALVRNLLDDVDVGAGYVWPDANLYNFGSSVQRRIFRRLRIRGTGEGNTEITRNVTPADSQISATLPVGQELPDDFVKPLMLWEKLSGAADNTYQLMSNMTERIPDETSTEAIRYWMWEDDQTASAVHPAIKFNPPTTNRVVRILYERTIYPAIAASSYVLRVYDSIDAMASGIAELCCRARGETRAAETWRQKFQQDLDELERTSLKGEQRRARRRLSYSYMKALNS